MPRNTLHRWGSQRSQPAGVKPALRNRELRPSAIQADLNVGRRSHRRMAEGSWSVTKQANLGRNHGNCPGLTLGTHHASTSSSVKLFGGNQNVIQLPVKRNGNSAHFPPECKNPPNIHRPLAHAGTASA